MRILDLGCGRAKSSIFFAREFGVEVWAADLWIDPTENWQRACDFGLQDRIHPLRVDARRLPFPESFFDAIVSIDSIQYYGTDDLFLPYVIQYLKPGGLLGFASAGAVQEVSHPVPQHLARFWGPDTWCIRGAGWWREHWERTGLVHVRYADAMTDGWKLWRAWAEATECSPWYLETLTRDAGKYLGYVRLVAEKAADAPGLPYNLQTGASVRVG